MLAVPGDLATPTGGYAYARRVLEAEWLDHLDLPGGFPRPNDAALTEAGRRLASVPGDRALIVDGLAFGVLPAAMVRGLAAPVVALCHHPLARETGLDQAEARRLRDAERAALAEATGVVATSRATAAELVRDYGAGHVAVAPPGTDPAPPAVGSGEAAPVLLSVGTLVPRKGHGLLLRALARIADRPWRAEIVGAADRDPAEARRLGALRDALGLRDRVAFAGALDGPTLARRYHGADIFALASEHEGFGMVFAEAVARSLAVLGPDLPAVAEATAGGAWLLPRDEAAWAEALGRLLDPAARRRQAETARRAAARLPGWADTIEALRGAAAAVLERRR